MADSCFIHSRMQCCRGGVSWPGRQQNLGIRHYRGPCGNCARIFQTLQSMVRKVFVDLKCPPVWDLHSGQSSPGYLHVGHVPSKWTWQIPQTSSSGISHRQVATAFHLFILTFIEGVGVVEYAHAKLRRCVIFNLVARYFMERYASCAAWAQTEAGTRAPFYVQGCLSMESVGPS